ncbi:MAG: multiple antibiotic resistance protein [bacterium]|jgi:multiple antibiotic resistance protein
MDWQIIGTTFVTITVLMDPVGIAPIFVAMTRALDPAARRSAAIRAVFAAGALIIGFALFGGLVLDYLNVSVHSLSIAGGLLLLLVALEMLRGQDYPDETSDEDIALVPLATPLLAGPGAIATVIVLSRQHEQIAGRIAVIAGILCALAVVGVVMLAAERVSRAIPPSIVNFLTRVFGLLLSAFAVQLIVNGIAGTLHAA